MSGPHFRDYHLLLDEQAAQIFAHRPIRWPSAPARSAARRCARSAHIAQLQRLKDNDAEYVDAAATCWRSCARTISRLVAAMRATHDLCDEHNDVATTSLIENWIDEAEQRIWFLFETSRADR